MRRCVKPTTYNETTFNEKAENFLNFAFMSPVKLVLVNLEA